jgi:hypothetical protein
VYPSIVSVPDASRNAIVSPQETRRRVEDATASGRRMAEYFMNISSVERPGKLRRTPA